MSPIPLVNIYILNWNQPQLTLDCVRSIHNQVGDIPYEIFIIDNGSTDDSRSIFQGALPGVLILSNEKNLGFQGGMNTGLRHALQTNIEFILLLNNDTIADRKMLQELFDHLPADAGLVSPIMYYFEAPDQPWSIGGKINPLFLEVARLYRKHPPAPKVILERDFLPSCAWLIKKEVVDQVGLLDERFFPIYYDDLDYCLRVRRHGYGIYLIPQAKLWHKVSLSVGGQHSPKERYLMARNSGYYFKKHMRWWQALPIILFRAGSAVLWTIRLLIKGDIEALQGYWRGIQDGWLKKMPE